MKTLLLANRKGGVGKSALACQLAFYFAQQRWRVLLLDFDHQCNASACLGKSRLVTVGEQTAAQLLSEAAIELPAGEFVLVPGSEALGELERQPERHNAAVNALLRFLDTAAPRFDVCVIDTNPNPDIRYGAAMIAADFLLSPIELNQEAVDGIAGLLRQGRYGYHRVKAALNPRLELIGVLPNLVEPTQYQRANLQQLVTSFASLLIPVLRQGQRGYAYIPTRTAIAEAQSAGVPLWLLRQAVPAHLQGKIDTGSMPLRSAARDAWHEVRPTFEEIARRMGLGGKGDAGFVGTR